MKTNYHTHCSLCDGIADPEEVVRTAIEKEFDILGFSSHSPLEGEDWTLTLDGVGTYVSRIRELQEKYKDRIALLLGMERDFNPFEPVWQVKRWDTFQLDYVIGSVHMMHPEEGGKAYSVDGSKEEVTLLIDRMFEGNARRMIEHYYDLVALMVSRERMDFVGHLDVVKKRNRVLGFFKETDPWYLKKVKEVLDVIAQRAQRIEINTGGISRGATDSLYPSQPLLRESQKRGIPIVINSDSHDPQYLDGEFPLARDAAWDAGYREHWILEGGTWRPIPQR